MRTASSIPTYLRNVSSSLARAVNDMAFAKIGHYMNYLKPHLQQTQRELRNMESQLPQHSPTLEVADREIILAKPLAQIHTVSGT